MEKMSRFQALAAFKRKRIIWAFSKESTLVNDETKGFNFVET
jgi:hypothetical protein